jgi:hypothetical protein
MALPALNLEIDLNPGDVYFLVSEPVEFLEEPDISSRGQQAPSSDEDEDQARERIRVDTAIKKGRKIVRRNAFLRR